MKLLKKNFWSKINKVYIFRYTLHYKLFVKLKPKIEL